MTDAPQPRPRGRPRKPGAPTSAERTRRWRESGTRVDVVLTGPAETALERLKSSSSASVKAIVSDALLRAAASLSGPA